jgi:hypothetical protein
VALAFGMPALRAADPAPAPSEIAARYGQQRVRQILAERLPGYSAAVIEQIAGGFEDHLRRSSRVQSENYAEGRMDDSELVSRVSVYLHDNPGMLGRRGPAAEDPAAAVRAALATRETAPRSAGERAALAQRFLANLAERNRLAHQNLLAGRMNADELASRITVFLEDLRTETAAAAAPDPAETAAAELVAEQFLVQNFGAPNERATTLTHASTITDAATGRAQSLQVMRKSPNRVRLHLRSGDLVTLVFAYDGTATWVQRPSRTAEPLDGEHARHLVESADFDHPLVGYKERGARLSVRGGGPVPFELTLREPDGRTIVSTIDPLTYEESRQVVQSTSGQMSELRLRDYRRAGPMNIPCTQELWRDGHLQLTTTIAEPATDAILLDELFARPSDAMVDYMDYMGGLALLQARRPAAPAASESGQP